jgi:ABC-type multidrug transport system ATPase subunit
LEIPKGFATALIGENGAGKTTLPNILSGIRLDFKGEVFYFVAQDPGLDSSIQEYLDPLMREQLCDRMRDYLDEGNGEHSIFFSTHNIADMENVTDYAIIMEHGAIVEEGFVEDLKEEYVLVKGEAADAGQAGGILLSMNRSAYGFEGICHARDLDRLSKMDVAVEIPTLSQICVAVMKANSQSR